jgi:hypothetical protein
MENIQYSDYNLNELSSEIISKYDQIKDTLKWGVNKKEDRSCYWGQLKLLMSEIEFLEIISKEINLADYLLVYVGSAPGTHLNLLCLFYPELTYLLYDIRKIEVTPGKNIYMIDGENGMFTDAKIKEVLTIADGKPIIYINDMRLDTSDERVWADMYNQQKWGIMMNADYMFLKFRLPYGDDLVHTKSINNINNANTDISNITENEFFKNNIGEIKDKLIYILPKKTDYSNDYNVNYLHGTIYLQCYEPNKSAETRLFVKKINNKYQYTTYNYREYEEKLNFFNIIIRTKKHTYKNSNTLKKYIYGADDSYDVVRSYKILLEFSKITDVIETFNYIIKYLSTKLNNNLIICSISHLHKNIIQWNIHDPNIYLESLVIYKNLLNNFIDKTNIIKKSFNNQYKLIKSTTSDEKWYNTDYLRTSLNKLFYLYDFIDNDNDKVKTISLQPNIKKYIEKQLNSVDKLINKKGGNDNCKLFNKYINNKQINIPFDILTNEILSKLNISTNNFVKCLSFYINNKEISFPYKKYFIKNIEEYFNNGKKYLQQNNIITQPYKIRNIISTTNNFFKLFPLQHNSKYIYIKNTNSDYDKLNVLTDFFTEKPRIKSIGHGEKLSPYDYWIQNNEQLTTELLKNKQSLNTVNYRELLYSKLKEARQGRITVSIALFNYFKPRTILDPSSAWGDRLIASIIYDSAYYCGVDPNIDLKKGHDKIINMWGESNKINMIYKPFETVILPDNIFYDLIIMSPPPYFGDIYGNPEGQSTTNYKSFEEWFVHFMVPYVYKASLYLNNNKHLIITILDRPKPEEHKYQIVEPLNLAIQFICKDLFYDGVIGWEGTSVVPYWIWKKDINKSNSNKINNAQYLLKKFYPDIFNKLKNIDYGDLYFLPNNKLLKINKKYIKNTVDNLNITEIDADNLNYNKQFYKKYAVPFYKIIVNENQNIFDIFCIINNKIIRNIYNIDKNYEKNINDYILKNKENLISNFKETTSSKIKTDIITLYKIINILRCLYLYEINSNIDFDKWLIEWYPFKFVTNTKIDNDLMETINYNKLNKNIHSKLINFRNILFKDNIKVIEYEILLIKNKNHYVYKCENENIYISIKRTIYDKLKNINNNDNDIFELLLNYELLENPFDNNSRNLQGSLLPDIFDYLKTQNINYELFAAPQFSHLDNYFSVFEIDKKFNSNGSFFDFDENSLKNKSFFAEAAPPNSIKIINQTINKLINIINIVNEYLLILFLPDWNDINGYHKLNKYGKYYIIPKYTQIYKSNNLYEESVYTTIPTSSRIYILTNIASINPTEIFNNIIKIYKNFKSDNLNKYKKNNSEISFCKNNIDVTFYNILKQNNIKEYKNERCNDSFIVNRPNIFKNQLIINEYISNYNMDYLLNKYEIKNRYILINYTKGIINKILIYPSINIEESLIIDLSITIRNTIIPLFIINNGYFIIYNNDKIDISLLKDNKIKEMLYTIIIFEFILNKKNNLDISKL